MENLRQFIEDNISSIDVSHRWGTIKVNVSSLFPEIIHEPCIMWSSQNYLWGGMLWSIGSGSMFDTRDLTPEHYELYKQLAEEIKKFHHELTNHSDDEFESQTYEQNQCMSHSAY